MFPLISLVTAGIALSCGAITLLKHRKPLENKCATCPLYLQPCGTATDYSSHSDTSSELDTTSHAMALAE